MTINTVTISLNSGLGSEHEDLNTYLLAGWKIIGHSTFSERQRYGESNEFFGEESTFEHYTLFKPDQTTGEFVVSEHPHITQPANDATGEAGDAWKAPRYQVWENSDGLTFEVDGEQFNGETFYELIDMASRTVMKRIRNHDYAEYVARAWNSGQAALSEGDWRKGIHPDFAIAENTPAEPTDSGAAGYSASGYRVENNGHALLIHRGDANKIAAFLRLDQETEAEILAVTLNNQTAALRAQLATVTAENGVMRLKSGQTVIGMGQAQAILAECHAHGESITLQWSEKLDALEHKRTVDTDNLIQQIQRRDSQLATVTAERDNLQRNTVSVENELKWTQQHFADAKKVVADMKAAIQKAYEYVVDHYTELDAEERLGYAAGILAPYTENTESTES